ncbi:alkaline phosphatase [Procambarus clarkii]|uniref:alkaline phosphatase n=1 Tax=Procambarus clarkii TaxID=6728 RepID=UPI003742407B
MAGLTLYGKVALMALNILVVTAQGQKPVSKDRQLWWSLAQNDLAAALNVRDNWSVAKNIILFLGDGMGITANTAARIYKGQKQGRNGEEGYLAWERFPNVALLKTYNVDRQVPDSAATATAFLCGIKANYYTLGVDSSVKLQDCPASKNTRAHVSSILQWAQFAGMTTGLVTTTRVTHATPAALYAHTADRRWECDGKLEKAGVGCKDIADQLVTENPGRNIRVILGGGRRELGTPHEPQYDESSCSRLDGRNLAQEWLAEKVWRGASARYVTTADDLRKVSPNNTDFLLGLFSDSHLPYVVERERETQVPSLEEMTLKAIDILQSSKNGFFLLVEGGRIDHGLHNNSAYRALEEALQLDAAVAAALRKVDLENTLVVTTADHSHVMTINGYPNRGNDILGVTGYKSDVDGLNFTTLMFTTGPGFNYTTDGNNVTRHDPNTHDTRDLDYQSLAAVPKKWETHGGEDVAVWAAGPMAHLLHRTHEQNYLAHVMAHAAGIGPSYGRRKRPDYDLRDDLPPHSTGADTPTVRTPPGPADGAAPKRPNFPTVNPALQQLLDDKDQKIVQELGTQDVSSDPTADELIDDNHL